MNYPLGKAPLITSPHHAEESVSFLQNINGIAISGFQSGQIGGQLQDAYFINSAQERYARDGVLRELFLQAATAMNRKLYPDVNKHVGAVSCVAYIPSTHTTTAPDSVIIGNTGDSHAMIFAVNGCNVTATLLTRNQQNSFAFFSAHNTDRFQIIDNKHLYPTIETHRLSKFRTDADTKLYLGLFTDGALPGVDQAHTAREINTIEEYAAKAMRDWRLRKSWQGEAACNLAREFGERARRTHSNDCVTALITRLKEAPSHGVIMGVIDGQRAEGSAEFALGIARMMRTLA